MKKEVSDLIDCLNTTNKKLADCQSLLVTIYLNTSNPTMKILIARLANEQQGEFKYELDKIII